MIAAIVVPFGCRNIPSTASCLDEALVGLAETALGVAVGGMALRFPPKDLVVRDCLVTRFAGFDLGLLVAIWLSLISTTASRAATDTSPLISNARAKDEVSGELWRHGSAWQQPA
jgi:hypothetical protein